MAVTGVTPPVLGMITSSEATQPLAVVVFVQRRVTFPDCVPSVRLNVEVGDPGVLICTPDGDAPTCVQAPVSPLRSAFPARVPAGLALHLAVKSGPALAIGVAETVTV